MRYTHLWWLLWLKTAAQLRLQIDGPAAYDHSQFIVKGDSIRITVQTNATDVCIFIDDTRHCSPDRVVEVSGLAPGTRVIAASAGTQTAEVVFDVIPAEELPTRPLPENHIAEPLELPLRPLKRRLNYCALSNNLERHSQNLIFLRTAALLDRRRWTASIFVPANTNGELHEDFRRAFIPVHYVDLSTMDFRDLRKQTPDKLDPRMASLLSKCDVHVYANTYDDPDAAALAELAVRYASPHSKRVMELPNLHPPSVDIVDAFIAPSHFAASHTETALPIATIYPASIGTPLPRAPRRKGVFVVAHAGRLAPERSPGLFVRVAALVRSRRPRRRGAFESPSSARWRRVARIDGVEARHTQHPQVRRDARFAQRAPFPGMPRDERPYVRFVMYGDGPLRPALERLSASLGAGVEFRGHSANLREQLSNVDVLLQPRPRGETFGIANAEASSAGCVVLAYMRSGANESCGETAHLLDTLDPQAYADVLMYLVLTGQRAAPTFDERFDSTKFASRYDRFLSSLVKEVDAAEDVVSGEMSVFFSPSAAYASGLISRALSKAFAVTIVETEAPDLVVASCLDGGCADGWSDHCQREAFAVAAKAPLSILICGEAWDLTPALSTFDIVLSTAFSESYAYLPVAATAFGELQGYTPHDLLLPKPKETRHGVAYLYYRCRPHRERFVELLRSEGLVVDALGRCSSNSEDDFVPRRFAERWHDDAIEQYASYKFVVAFENDNKAGYVTEKLGLAFLAGSVPIYWGPSTEHIFSNESYVRCHELEACARRVKRLDGDDLLYERMRNAPKVNDLSILQASNLTDALIARLQPKFVLRYPRRD
jgi:glycosyltransferase involved in cell wall biosynthesis